MNSDQVNLTNSPDLGVQNPNNTPVPSLGEPGIAKKPELQPNIVASKPEVGPQPQPASSNNQASQPVQQTQTSGTVWSNQLHSSAQSDRAKIAQSIAKMSAQDDDLIEKEWVDVTEKVIDSNKDDPYNEDEDQHVLSRHYLKKRFNLDVK